MQQPLPAQPPALPPGTLLGGRYLVQGYIGGGGFGHIYKAHDKVLGHRRAIKEAFYRDPQTAQQFRLEAEFILNARHPNLVRGYAVFEQAGRFYLVMDYVDGQTVEEIAIRHIRSTGHPLAERQVLDWILPICDAVQALHSQPTPIIHRDVKPANIKITRKGIPILIDLGLAKLFSQGTNTIGAALAFTPGYAPPEQYQASGATDQRTDVYGMGATLFYLLTGYQPTESPARLRAHALPEPRALNHHISSVTQAAVLRAMTMDPVGRQQTMRELLHDLQIARVSLDQATQYPETVLGERLVPCTRCGTANPLPARFCMRCGGPVEDDPTASQARPTSDESGYGLRLVNLAEAEQPHTSHAEPRQDDPTTQAPLSAPSLVVSPLPLVATPLPVEPARAPAAAPVAVVPRVPVVTPAAITPRLPDAPAPIGKPAVAVRAVPPTPLTAPVIAQGSLSRRSTLRPGTSLEEAQAVIAAILAGVSGALSFLAVLAWWGIFSTAWTLVFAAPAVAFGVWSWLRLRQRAGAPEEFMVLACAAWVCAASWPVVWFCGFLLTRK
ncbi:MAG TPA: serine/threonine-protein kinase [Ktedonobacterales bacterium]|nr:serine/threonine-protein kinase [Ktedonobacterales bacterium]